jgi:glyoxylase-like metal-dependent hydrolase (beta-lactamase superfamily II)
MTLRIETFPAGPIETNAYLVTDEATGRALVIDAPWEAADVVLDAAARSGAAIELIFITHGHWDHIGDAADLKARTGAPLVSHRLCEEALSAPGSPLMDLPFTIEPATIDRYVEEGDTVALGESAFVVLHLPGHEPGHTVLYSEADRVLLGGDVLFPNGHGRIDIPGASEADMAASLARLAELPADVTVYPGHGLPTTIGAEASWLQAYRRGSRQ